jgi:hypothetical protein
VAVAALVAGCGSSGSTKPNASPTTPTTTVRTAPNTPEQLAADKALARRAVLRLTDLPRGYKLAPDQSDDSSSNDTTPAQAQRFATCAHVSAEVTKTLLRGDPPPGVVQVESKDFEHDVLPTSQITLSGTVDIGRTPADVGNLIPIVGSASAPGCWKNLFDEMFGSGSAHGTYVADVHVAPYGAVGLGDRSGGLHVRLVATSAGLSVPIDLAIVAAQHGRMAVLLVVTGFGKTPENGIERTLLQKMLDRLDAAA